MTTRNNGRSNLDPTAKLFQGLGNDARLKIMRALLTRSGMRETDLLDATAIPRANFTHHLYVLLDIEALVRVKDCNVYRYSLSDKAKAILKVGDV